MDSIESRLKIAGVRRTQPRLNILRKMAQSKQHLWTINELQRALSGCDLVTIYRTLALFQREGIVSRCEMGDGTTRYELIPENGDHHHHIVCRECGELKRLDLCVAEGIEAMLEKEGYRQVAHSFEVLATCAKC